EISPEIFETDRTAMKRDPETPRITNHRRKIVIAIVHCIREECFLRRIINKRRTLGEPIERALVLWTDQATRSRLLDRLANTFKNCLPKLFFVAVLHARIKWIAPLLAQVCHAILTIARRRAATIEPHAVKLVARNQLT